MWVICLILGCLTVVVYVCLNCLCVVFICIRVLRFDFAVVYWCLLFIMVAVICFAFDSLLVLLLGFG